MKNGKNKIVIGLLGIFSIASASKSGAISFQNIKIGVDDDIEFRSNLGGYKGDATSYQKFINYDDEVGLYGRSLGIGRGGVNSFKSSKKLGRGLGDVYASGYGGGGTSYQSVKNFVQKPDDYNETFDVSGLSFKDAKRLNEELNGGTSYQSVRKFERGVDDGYNFDDGGGHSYSKAHKYERDLGEAYASRHGGGGTSYHSVNNFNRANGNEFAEGFDVSGISYKKAKRLSERLNGGYASEYSGVSGDSSYHSLNKFEGGQESEIAGDFGTVSGNLGYVKAKKFEHAVNRGFDSGLNHGSSSYQYQSNKDQDLRSKRAGYGYHIDHSDASGYSGFDGRYTGGYSNTGSFDNGASQYNSYQGSLGSSEIGLGGIGHATSYSNGGLGHSGGFGHGGGGFGHATSYSNRGLGQSVGLGGGAYRDQYDNYDVRNNKLAY